jgi:hypothetical protein
LPIDCLIKFGSAIFISFPRLSLSNSSVVFKPLVINGTDCVAVCSFPSASKNEFSCSFLFTRNEVLGLPKLTGQLISGLE